MTDIQSDVWKKTRDQIARRVRRGLHVQETNPGPQHNLRYDYILTAAEVTTIVEEVMRETERMIHYASREKK